MAVAVQQAASARKSNQEVQKALVTVQLAAVTERLKSAQNHIRAIAPGKAGQRGLKPAQTIDELRQEFDTALSSLASTGPGSVAREMLQNAQNCLNSYDPKIEEDDKNTEHWRALQSFVQDAMSNLTEAATKPGS